jgi:hypothetical protein
VEVDGELHMAIVQVLDKLRHVGEEGGVPRVASPALLANEVVARWGGKHRVPLHI